MNAGAAPPPPDRTPHIPPASGVGGPPPLSPKQPDLPPGLMQRIAKIWDSAIGWFARSFIGRWVYRVLGIRDRIYKDVTRSEEHEMKELAPIGDVAHVALRTETIKCQNQNLDAFLTEYQQTCDALSEGESGDFVSIHKVISLLGQFKGILGSSYKDPVPIRIEDKTAESEADEIEKKLAADRNIPRVVSHNFVVGITLPTTLCQRYGLGEQEVLNLAFVETRIPQILMSMVDFSALPAADLPVFGEFFAKIDSDFASLKQQQQNMSKLKGNFAKLQSVVDFLETHKGSFKTFFSYPSNLFNFREFLMARLTQLESNPEIFDPQQNRQKNDFYKARRELEVKGISPDPAVQTKIIALYLNELATRLDPKREQYMEYLVLFNRMHLSLTGFFLFHGEETAAVEVVAEEAAVPLPALSETAKAAQQKNKIAREAESESSLTEGELRDITVQVEGQKIELEWAESDLKAVRSRSISDNEIRRRISFFSEDFIGLNVIDIGSSPNFKTRFANAETKVRELEGTARGADIEKARAKYNELSEAVVSRGAELRAARKKTVQERATTKYAKTFRVQAEKDAAQSKLDTATQAEKKAGQALQNARKALREEEEEQAKAKRILEEERLKTILIGGDAEIDGGTQRDLKEARAEVKAIIAEAKTIIQQKITESIGILKSDIGETEQRTKEFTEKLAEQKSTATQSRTEADETFLAAMPHFLERLKSPTKIDQNDADVETLFSCLPPRDQEIQDQSINIARIVPIFLMQCCDQNIREDLTSISQSRITQNFAQHRIRQILQYACKLVVPAAF